MDNETKLLISSIVLNAFLLIKDIFNKIKKSECCGSKIEMRGGTSPEPVDHVTSHVTDHVTGDTKENKKIEVQEV